MAASSDTAVITVNQGPNRAPLISSGPTTTPNPANIGQAVTSSVTASDADGDSLSYSWDFGDSNSSTGANPTHTYNAAGTYTTTVTVSDGQGGSATGTVGVTVEGGGLPGDLNGDGVVNIADLTIVTGNFGTVVGDPGVDARADANNDGVINSSDLTIVTDNFGRT